eukprot:UN06544
MEYSEFPLQFRVLAYIRTPVIMFIVIPLSFLLRTYRTIKDKIIYYSSPVVDPKKSHKRKTDRVQSEVRAWIKSGKEKLLRTARPSWLTMSTRLGNRKDDDHRIDFSDFKSILEFDREKMTVTLEPGVNMGQVTDLLGPENLALMVQVEMESLTIGGLVLGVGMETNCHKCGLIQETVVAYEIVLSDGSIKWITEENDPATFWAMPWSYGSFGFLTAVKVRLQRTKPYVLMTYIPTNSLDELQREFERLSLEENGPDFLEATVYSKDKAVLQLGTYIDAEGAKKYDIYRAGLWFQEWYYKHVGRALSDGQFQECLPLRDYWHRFTKSIFWELEDMIPFGNHWLYRWFWAWMGPPEVSLLKLFQGPIVRKASIYAHVVQDIIIPIKEVKRSIENFAEWFDTYPLLVFPMKIVNHGEKGKYNGMLTVPDKNLQKGKKWGMYFDLGAYGVPQKVREKK